MELKIAGAPGAWGIEDPNNQDNPEYRYVLDAIHRSGYKGLELGPYGYLPLDVNTLRDYLEEFDLKIVAGTIYDDLVSEDRFAEILNKTHNICRLISRLPKIKKLEGQRYKTPYLVIIDSVKEERNTVAGHYVEARRLPQKEWMQMVEHIKGISEVAKAYGIRPVIHPHAGGYIEFEDEIQKIVEDLDYEEVGLCLDTGHLYYSGMNPGKMIEIYKDRIDYMHFKDIDENIYQHVLKNHIGFFEGCSLGTMCPIGSGAVDYQEVNKALENIQYNGWVTIEQERDPKQCELSLGDAIKSIQFLKNIGYKLD